MLRVVVVVRVACRWFNFIDPCVVGGVDKHVVEVEDETEQRVVVVVLSSGCRVSSLSCLL